MTSLLKFGSREGRERSLLALFILHSLSKSPKSGYDLLAEIREKTGGLWAPSKGTLYPVLHQLEDEHLIEGVATGKRAKTTFEVTEDGKKALEDVKERRREGHEKMACCRDLLSDIFGGTKVRAHSLLFDIHQAFEELPPGSEDKAFGILEQCLKDLKEI